MDLPEGKVLIPGVIDTTTNIVEHPQLVADRIVRIAKIVGRENVVAGTDCGFSTAAGGFIDAPRGFRLPMFLCSWVPSCGFIRSSRGFIRSKGGFISDKEVFDSPKAGFSRATCRGEGWC